MASVLLGLLIKVLGQRHSHLLPVCYLCVVWVIFIAATSCSFSLELHVLW